MTWQLCLAGLLIGALVGVTGMGGGSLMTPILILLFGFSPSVAVGTDIVHGAIFKTVGGLRHRVLGNVQARLSGWMLLGSAPMSLLGVAVATWLKHRYGSGLTSVQGHIVGAALVFGAIGLYAKMLVTVETPTAGFTMRRRDRIAAVLIGAIGGFIVGLTSVGSGTFFGLTMLVLFPLRAVKVVGTDIFHGAALLWVAGAGHLVAGNVNVHAIGWLLIGSIPGIVIGSQLSLNVPERLLRMSLATMLLLTGIKLLPIPGNSWFVVAGLGVGACVLLVLSSDRVRARKHVDGLVDSAASPTG